MQSVSKVGVLAELWQEVWRGGGWGRVRVMVELWQAVQWGGGWGRVRVMAELWQAVWWGGGWWGVRLDHCPTAGLLVVSYCCHLTTSAHLKYELLIKYKRLHWLLGCWLSINCNNNLNIFPYFVLYFIPWKNLSSIKPVQSLNIEVHNKKLGQSKYFGKAQASMKATFARSVAATLHC